MLHALGYKQKAESLKLKAEGKYSLKPKAKEGGQRAVFAFSFGL
jgi:hypothetical protein